MDPEFTEQLFYPQGHDLNKMDQSHPTPNPNYQYVSPGSAMQQQPTSSPQSYLSPSPASQSQTSYAEQSPSAYGGNTADLDLTALGLEDPQMDFNLLAWQQHGTHPVVDTANVMEQPYQYPDYQLLYTQDMTTYPDLIPSDPTFLATLEDLCKSTGETRIEIHRQPQTKGYRFRYEIEGKAHGGIQAEGTIKGNKKFPLIQLKNVSDRLDTVYLQIRLIQITDDIKPHPNKLQNGKSGCNESGIVAMVLRKRDHKDWNIDLKNLQIIQTKREDREASLRAQLKYLYRNQIKPVHDIEKETKEESDKRQPAGVVRIRFDLYDNLNGDTIIATAISDVIYDAKAPACAELKICRQSVCSAPVTGDCEVYLLCEKVSKDDVEVHFAKDAWTSKAKFVQTDVHYQHAIVYRVPPYRDLSITQPVDVEVFLFRPTTTAKSQSLTFTYMPNKQEDHMIKAKRKRPNHQGPTDIQPYNPYNGGPGGYYQAGSGGGSNGGTGGGLYPAGAHGGYTGGGNTYRRDPTADSNDDVKPVDLSVNSSEVEIADRPRTIDEVESDSTKPSRPPKSPKSPPAVNEKLPPRLPKPEPSNYLVKDDKIKTARIDSGIDSKYETIVCDDEVEPDCAVRRPATPARMHRSIQKSVIAEKPAPTKEATSLSRNQIDTNSARNKKAADREKFEGVTESGYQSTAGSEMVSTLTQTINDFEDGLYECIQNYAITGDEGYFLSKFRRLMCTEDEHGDNAINLAVINGQPKALSHMLNISSRTEVHAVINHPNDMHQTPITTATILGEVETVSILLQYGANPYQIDGEGNNCFHVAAKRSDVEVCKVLCDWAKLTGKNPKLDTPNYAGMTALHLAVQNSSWPCAKHLLKAGIDINLGDRLSGKTALHHAVSLRNYTFIKNLLLETRTDVNTTSFDCRTALHLAVADDNETAVRLIMSSHDVDTSIEDSYTLTDCSDDEYEADSRRPGHDVFYLARANPTITKLLKKPGLGVSRPAAVKPIVTLPEKTMRSLCKRLDVKSNDWIRLAEKLDLSALVQQIKSYTGRSPTEQLIEYYLARSGTTKGLIDALQKIGQDDSATIVSRVTGEALTPPLSRESSILTSRGMVRQTSRVPSTTAEQIAMLPTDKGDSAMNRDRYDSAIGPSIRSSVSGFSAYNLKR